MKDKTIRRINTWGKVGHIVCIILKIAIILGALSMIMLCLDPVNDPKALAELEQMVGSDAMFVYDIVQSGWQVAGLLVGFAGMFVLLCFAGKLCKLLKTCQTPFSKEISKALLGVAWSMVAVDVVTIPLALVVDMGVSEDIVLTSIFTEGIVISCLFLVAYIFKHGVALQTEADELL